ncbi:MAG: cupin domain-containing protein [Gemmataceae bacterium]|nr:cupin domain-containing protein [Gemmataceae bacterium]
MTAEQVIRELGLVPLPAEGGYYRETFRSPITVGHRSCGTAIYYLLTNDSPSRLHRVSSDEQWHFYLGDPAEQIQLLPDGMALRHILGTDLLAGQRPQLMVPARAWQSTRLLPGGQWALCGATVTPGFEFTDFEIGEEEILAVEHAAWAKMLGRG